MVVWFVKPVSVTALSASVLVFLETLIVPSVPLIVAALTFIGPFVPLASSAWNRRRELNLDDVQNLYDPLYSELSSIEEMIVAADRGDSLFNFSYREFADLRLSYRYQLLTAKTPIVEEIRALIQKYPVASDTAWAFASNVLADAVQRTLDKNGTNVYLEGRNKRGDTIVYTADRVRTCLLRELNPYEVFEKQEVKIWRMTSINKTGQNSSSFPLPEQKGKYDAFWNDALKRAREDQSVRKFRELLNDLREKTAAARVLVLDKLRKSRNVLR